MGFSSAEFLFLFLPCVLLIYYNPFFRSRRFKNIFLLLVSLFFYAWGEPVYVLLLILSILINWILGGMVGANQPHRRAVLAIAVLFNLAGLFVFKYLGQHRTIPPRAGGDGRTIQEPGGFPRNGSAGKANQATRQGLSARIRFARANTKFSLAVCFRRPRYCVFR